MYQEKMDFEKLFILKAFDSLKNKSLTNPDIDDELFDKNIENSTRARQKGNQMFSKKNHNEKVHKEIWKLYTKSIAYAPTASEELAAGFANRSAFLLHLRKYEDALLDIERALKITQSSALKVKLFCRQAECYVAVQKGKQSNSLEKAKYWLNKVEDDSEIIKLGEIMRKAEKAVESNIPDYPEKVKKHNLTCKNDAVTICYDQKYGRGLIATRDIKPGELVYIEKFYVASVEKSKLYAYCSHCLGISWNLIPCEHCACYLYCSEKCRTKAWQKYHDIECRLRQQFTLVDDTVTLCVRCFIMGIRESGSIKKLKDLITKIDHCKDDKRKGFSEDGKFSSNSFKSFYSLRSSKDVDKTRVDSFTVVMLVQAFAKFTEIFGKNFQYGSGENLMQHKDALFIGCLLLRLMSIINLNAFHVQCMTESCKNQHSLLRCLQETCCARGLSISLFTNLINHNCDNNVNKFYTNDGKVVYYAVKSIKRDSQIFSSYYCDYMTSSKILRQAILWGFFEIHCDCKACRQNWPTLNFLDQESIGESNQCTYKNNTSSIKILRKHESLIASLGDDNPYVSRKDIQSLAKDFAVVNAVVTPEPDTVTATFQWALNIMMDLRYFDKLKIPSTCGKSTK